MNKRKYLLTTIPIACALWASSSCVSVRDIYTPETQPTPSLNQLADSFSSSDVNERAQAALQAGFYYNHPDKAVLIPYLVGALQESDCGPDCDRVRAAAAQSIRMLRIYDEQALNILISWLEEPGHSSDEIVQSIQTIEAFSVSAPDATASLIYVIGNMGSSYSNNSQIKAAAARAVSKFRNPAAVPYLLSLVLTTSEPDWIRKEASISLSRYGHDSSCTIPYLIPMLDSVIPDLRISASLIISQAAKEHFTDSNPENWDPDFLGPWKFETNANGEYSIVVDAKEWWEIEGSQRDWPECGTGIHGENVLP